jgi:segregation and condensation protein B
MATSSNESCDPTRIVEAVLFIGADASLADLRQVARIDVPTMAETVDRLNARYEAQNRPYRIESTDEGRRLRLNRKTVEWVRERLRPDRGVRLGRPALEVLAAIAYRQPLTRSAIESLTNSDAGSALRRLLRMKLIEQSAGDIDEPAEFRTTARFLKAFRLESPTDLPVVAEQ